MGLEGEGTGFESKMGNSCYMKNPKQRHVQGSGQQHIHPLLPHIVISFRQLSSEKCDVYLFTTLLNGMILS